MKKSHYFIYSLLLSLPFWWGVNVFGYFSQGYFMDLQIAKDPKILKAQMLSSISLPRAPERLEINAKSAISIAVKPDGETEIIYEKNLNEKLAIASLTKLMSAYVILNNLDLSKEITVSESSFLSKSGFFPGQIFKAKDLLYASMTESSNEGITILTQPFGLESFLNLMNMEAKYMGLKSTEFFNPTGLDPDFESEKPNYSTVADLAVLVKKLFENPLAFEMLSLNEFDLYDTSGVFIRKSVTTNNLLGHPEILNGLTILGGKTGETPLAKGCLALVTKNSKNEMIISVILGSDNRFGEMAELSDWSNKMANYKRALALFY